LLINNCRVNQNVSDLHKNGSTSCSPAACKQRGREEDETPDETGEDTEEDEETVPLDQVTWHDLKLNPGPSG
jgi:hypothetical protein